MWTILTAENTHSFSIDKRRARTKRMQNEAQSKWQNWRARSVVRREAIHFIINKIRCAVVLCILFFPLHIVHLEFGNQCIRLFLLFFFFHCKTFNEYTHMLGTRLIDSSFTCNCGAFACMWRIIIVVKLGMNSLGKLYVETMCRLGIRCLFKYVSVFDVVRCCCCSAYYSNQIGSYEQLCNVYLLNCEKIK